MRTLATLSLVVMASLFVQGLMAQAVPSASNGGSNFSSGTGILSDPFAKEDGEDSCSLSTNHAPS